MEGEWGGAKAEREIVKGWGGGHTEAEEINKEKHSYTKAADRHLLF